jgi:hypothetical protein
MSGLIKFKFGFENSLKFGFEKFEKEKEKGNFPLRAETFLPAQCSACSGGPPFPRQRPLPDSLGRAQAAASRPTSRARGLLSHRAADEPVPPVSVSFPFPSPSSR